jgi:hypothetical protein
LIENQKTKMVQSQIYSRLRSQTSEQHSQVYHDFSMQGHLAHTMAKAQHNTVHKYHSQLQLYLAVSQKLILLIPLACHQPTVDAKMYLGLYLLLRLPSSEPFHACRIPHPPAFLSFHCLTPLAPIPTD